MSIQIIQAPQLYLLPASTPTVYTVKLDNIVLNETNV